MTDETTATKALEFAAVISRDGQIFRSHVESFIRQWQPENPRERIEFAADLTVLLHRTWMDTQSPPQRLVEALIKAATPIHLEGETDKWMTRPSTYSAPPRTKSPPCAGKTKL